jgi:hypothetical protein
MGLEAMVLGKIAAVLLLGKLMLLVWITQSARNPDLNEAKPTYIARKGSEYLNVRVRLWANRSASERSICKKAGLVKDPHRRETFNY